MTVSILCCFKIYNYVASLTKRLNCGELWRKSVQTFFSQAARRLHFGARSFLSQHPPKSLFEFTSINSARQAITAGHNSQGGGGVCQDPPYQSFHQSEKSERSKRPPPRPQGGERQGDAPVNGGEGGGCGGMRRGCSSCWQVKVG